MTDLASVSAAATALVALCKDKKLMIVTAESCTGGLIAGALTEVPGSSAVLERGFVTYSYPAKTEMLGVDAKLLKREGAVNAAVASAMAEGALARSPADLAIAVTGIAGPDGGTTEKPVGLVHFCALRRGGKPLHQAHVFENRGRDFIRLETVRHALGLLSGLANAPG